MTRFHANLIVVLLALVLATLAIVNWWPAASADGPAAATGASVDEREAVPLNAEQVQYSLSQMRGLLITMRDLDQAEATDDGAAMARLAAAQGPRGGSGGSGRGGGPAGLHEAQPAAFRAMSRSMRQGFAAMAAAATSGDMAAYSQTKNQVYSTCVACHESYRFTTR